MLQMATFTYDGPFPSYFANALAKVLSLQTGQLKLVQTDGTHLKIPATSNQGAAVIAIAGLWRFMEADVGPVAHPGGSAGEYPVFVTCKNNNISSTPNPFTDDTDYTFGLQICATGTHPTIVGGTLDQYLQIGSCTWSGTAITRLTQTFPSVGNHGATHATAGTDPMTPADIGAIPVGDTTALQPGDLIVSAAATRAGAILCDGSPISRFGANAALFAAINTQYGAGNGTSTFNVPDYRSRVIVGGSPAGAPGGGRSNRTRGDTGGEEAHSLSYQENGAHTHNGSGTTSGASNDHAHSFSGTTSDQNGLPGWYFAGLNSFDSVISAGVAGGTADTVPRAGTFGDNNWGGVQPDHTHTYSGGTSGQNTDHSHTYGFTTDAGGSTGAAHNNMQPFGVANVFIKL